MNTRKVCLFCLVLLLLSTAAHAKIVFRSERNGVKGIYIMDDDGSNQTLLIEGAGWPVPWSWSPDGTSILFDRGSALYLMAPDGTNIRQLTEKDAGTRASFSPDGKFIVYDRSRTENNKQKFSVEVLNIKTGQRKVILDRSVVSCDWSPDGRHILFAEPTSPGRSSTIWVMGADGHKPRPLLPNPGPRQVNFFSHRSSPRWSPDGRQVVFTEEERTFNNVLIFKAFRYMIYDRASDSLRKLSIPRDWMCYDIDWMDEGESVVFTARVGIPMDEPIVGRIDITPSNIYKYHIKRREITRLTDHPGKDSILDWISDDVLPVDPRGKKK